MWRKLWDETYHYSFRRASSLEDLTTYGGSEGEAFTH